MVSLVYAARRGGEYCQEKQENCFLIVKTGKYLNLRMDILLFIIEFMMKTQETITIKHGSYQKKGPGILMILKEAHMRR